MGFFATKSRNELGEKISAMTTMSQYYQKPNENDSAVMLNGSRYNIEN